MKKSITLFAMLFITIALNAQTKPTDTDGDGYYNISTLDHLRWVSENDSCWTWNFELDNDIDAADTKNWNEGDHDDYAGTPDSCMGWSPIGYSDKKTYSGNFDGNGYSIKRLYIRSVRIDYGAKSTGFFGVVSKGTIKNLSILDCDIKTGLLTGAIAGRLYSTIENCHSSGKIYSFYSDSGGLVGLCDNESMITRSSSTVNIIGRGIIGGLVATGKGKIFFSFFNGNIISEKGYAGGIVGSGSGTMKYCYARGSIKGKYGAGGLFGINGYGYDIDYSYSTCLISGNGEKFGPLGGTSKANGFSSHIYWDIEASGKSKSFFGKGLTTKQLKDKEYLINEGWNFDVAWGINDTINQGYPYLINTYMPIDTDLNGFLNIYSFKQLYWLALHKPSWKYNFELDNDIDASETKNMNDGWGLPPIGSHSIPFTGIFDGNNYKIKNLHATDKSNKYYANIKLRGLFGLIESEGTQPAVVRNLNIINLNYNFSFDLYNTTWSGGIVVVNKGIISNCSSSGKIISVEAVGGIVSKNYGKILNCVSSINIDAYCLIGGITGVSAVYAEIINCYSSGDIKGVYTIGGLVGENQNRTKILNCYSTGKVFGTKNTIGGLIGKNENPDLIVSSFWDIETSGIDSSSGGIPKTTAEMKTKSTFTEANWDFETIWNIDPTINNGYPFLTSVSVSVLENKAEETNNLLIYPNPISQGNTLNITFENHIANYTIAIYNMEGVLVAKNNQFDRIQINENFPVGTYFIVVLDKGEIIASEKFIVK